MGSKENLPILNDFSILLTNNNRAKCYLQNLTRCGFIPTSVVYLESGEVSPNNTPMDFLTKDCNQTFEHTSKVFNCMFNEREHVLQTVEKYNIAYVTVNTYDLESVEVVDAINNLEVDYVIYAGPDGKILKKNILQAGKKFLHVHPGTLPANKGSTTIYYSLLMNENPGASVILFNEGIDQGPILMIKNYQFDTAVDPDYVYDPMIRTETLVQFFKENHNLSPKCINKSSDIEQDYAFNIIHPLLKHIALRNSGSY